MSFIPGWDSVAGANTWSNFWFWASICALIFLGISEVVSHRYAERKDELATQQQTDTEKRHNDEIARLQLEREQAHLETERIKSQVQWRRLTAEQSKQLTEAVTRRIWSINIEYPATDPEASVFAEDFIRTFRHAGIRSHIKQSIELAPPYKEAPKFGLFLSGPAGENWAVLVAALQTTGMHVQIEKIIFDDPNAEFTLTIGSKPPPF